MSTSSAGAPYVAARDVLLLGGSAGGVAALRELVAQLPADLPATVLVVLHLPRAGGSSILPDILDRAGPLPARAARSGEELVPGQVLVAPPERHLVVSGGRVLLTTGPAENGYRPSVDVLFRSAALDLGPRVVAAVLTGNLDDGSAGLRAVSRYGGAAVVQDPDDAMFPGMPRNALAAVPDARCAPLSSLAAVLTELVKGPPAPAIDPPEELRARDELEVRSARGEDLGRGGDDRPGEPSAYTCPDCTGVLFGIEDGPVLRYRCRTGHAWSAEALSERQEQEVETALWMALRALEERSAMARDVAAAAERSGRAWSREHFSARAAEADRHAEVLRHLLVEDQPDAAASPPDLHVVPSPGQERARPSDPASA